jgi:hypothetical protein
VEAAPNIRFFNLHRWSFCQLLFLWERDRIVAEVNNGGDLVDALVWALTDLMIEREPQPNIRFFDLPKFRPPYWRKRTATTKNRAAGARMANALCAPTAQTAYGSVCSRR